MLIPRQIFPVLFAAAACFPLVTAASSCMPPIAAGDLAAVVVKKDMDLGMAQVEVSVPRIYDNWVFKRVTLWVGEDDPEASVPVAHWLVEGRVEFIFQLAFGAFEKAGLLAVYHPSEDDLSLCPKYLSIELGQYG